MSSPEAEGSVVRTRAGGEVYVERRGTGPALVWVAGLGDDHTGWTTQVEQFSGQYTCVTFDNRGTGASTVLPGPYTMEDFADDAHDVVSALGITPVIAVGSSMGGAICQRWALRYPEDVSRLVLAGTWAEKDPLLDVLLRHWIKLGEDHQDQRLIESLFLGCYSGPYLREHPETVAEFMSTPLPDLEGLMASVAACRDHDALTELSTLNMPTLVISGTLDTVARTDLPERIASTVPNAQLKEIQSGHMMIWEQPDSFERIVREFITSAN
jgi:pimeloyl-ACP methyl ester carboxylesterase